MSWFWELCRDRRFQMGAIPTDAIDRFCERKGFTGKTGHLIGYTVDILDGAFLKFHADRQSESASA